MRSSVTPCFVALALPVLAMTSGCWKSHRVPKDASAGDTATDAAKLRDAGELIDVNFIDVSPDVPRGRPFTEVVLAHDEATLFELDPDTLELKVVGDFVFDDGSSGVVDIAVDAAGHIVASTSRSLYYIDGDTLKGTRFADVGGNGLAYVPANTIGLDNTREVLVGNDGGGSLGSPGFRAIFIADPIGGLVRRVASLDDGLGGRCSVSGDFVSVATLGTFATLNCAAHSPGGGNVLAKVNFAAGDIEIVGEIRSATRIFSGLWGLGYWGGTLYGFSSAGEIIEIDPQSAAAELISSQANISFWGAGVTSSVR